MHIDAIFGAIGRFAVRFRWLMLLVWIAAAIAAATQLPSLSSVTQNNNTKFLPASAPSEHAADARRAVRHHQPVRHPGGRRAVRPPPLTAGRHGRAAVAVQRS